eukprot:6212841-Pleurochrysis_carterae.AAC.2
MVAQSGRASEVDGRVTPLATLTRMLGLRCAMRLAGKRLQLPLAVRVEPLSTSANRAPPMVGSGIAE